MSRWLVQVGVGLWLVALATALTASPEPPTELWRSRYGTMWWSTPSSVNPTDGSIWLGEGPTVSHMSAEGVLLWRSETLHSGVGSVVVNPGDGSCWATDGWGTRLLHYSSEGVQLAAVADYRIENLSPSSADGSLWGIQLVLESGQGYVKYLAHVDAAGTELFRSTWPTSCVAVAPDGSAWGVDSAAHEAVHVAADGAELARLPGFYTIYALDPDDSTLWAMGDAGLTHVSSTETILAQIAPLGGQITVVPSHGTAWVVYQNPHSTAPAPSGTRSVYDPFVVHYASDGSVLRDYGETTDFKVLDRGDGSVWLTFANGDFVHVSASDQEVTHLSTFNHIIGLDPSDHTLWVEAGPERHLLLQHMTADGEVLWQDRIVGLSQSPGSSFWVDPQDGSCWVSDSYTAPLWEFVHLSAQGAELGRRTLPDDSRVPAAMCISPKDGTWWVVASETSSSTRRLLHLSAAGTELSRHDGVGTLLAVNPADGSVWSGEPMQTLSGGLIGTILKTHLHHFDAQGGLVWEGDSLGWANAFALDSRDGSLWIPTDSGVGGPAALQRLSPTGTVLTTLPRTESLEDTLSLAVNPTDGSIYVTTAVVGVGSGVTRLSPDGTVLWTNTNFVTAAELVLNGADGSVWVTDRGSQFSVPTGEGSALVHLAADGSELWRSGGYAPLSIALDPGDGSVWLTDNRSLQIVHLGRAPIFPDVPWRTWASEQIAACVSAGIVAGYPDGTYHPELVVTRDQMAVFVARALAGGDSQVPTGPALATFSDVSASGTEPFWAYKHIEFCAAQHVVAGYGDGTYRPALPVDRAQMAVFIARAVAPFAERPDLSGYTPPATPTFSDVSGGSAPFWAYKHIEYLSDHGVVNGYPDGTYHPEIACTRDQMAVFIARAFDLLP